MNAFMDINVINKRHKWIKADICLQAKPPNRRLDSDRRSGFSLAPSMTVSLNQTGLDRPCSLAAESPCG
jgi:hypothetical protein